MIPAWFDAMRRSEEAVDMASIIPAVRTARVSSEGFVAYGHPSVEMRVRNFPRWTSTGTISADSA